MKGPRPINREQQYVDRVDLGHVFMPCSPAHIRVSCDNDLNIELRIKFPRMENLFGQSSKGLFMDWRNCVSKTKGDLTI